MQAEDFLKRSADHLVDRGVHYDNKCGERSIDKVVTCFNELTGHKLSNEEGWLFMILLKLVRLQQGIPTSDSYEDLIAYSALMGEEFFKN